MLVRHSREGGEPRGKRPHGYPLFKPEPAPGESRGQALDAPLSRARRGPTQPDRMMLPRTVQQEQRETAKEQRAIWLFSQSVDPRQPRISAGDVMQLADNVPAEQQKQRAAPEAGSTDRGGDRGAEVLGAGVAAEVRGAGAAFGEDLGDGALDGRCRRALAEMVEHHRARPDLADRVGD